MADETTLTTEPTDLYTLTLPDQPDPKSFLVQAREFLAFHSRRHVNDDLEEQRYKDRIYAIYGEDQEGDPGAEFFMEVYDLGEPAPQEVTVFELTATPFHLQYPKDVPGFPARDLALNDPLVRSYLVTLLEFLEDSDMELSDATIYHFTAESLTLAHAQMQTLQAIARTIWHGMEVGPDLVEAIAALMLDQDPGGYVFDEDSETLTGNFRALYRTPTVELGDGGHLHYRCDLRVR